MVEVLRLLDEAFAEHPGIHEIGLTFGAAEDVVVVDDQLGLSAKQVKPLFRYVSRRYKELRHAAERDAEEVLSVTRGLLMVSPDHSDAWALRRRLILAGKLDPAAEVRFLRALFSKHGKAPSAWHHRRWLLRDAEGAWAQEATLTERTADRYPKNYYAWTHRLWAFRTFPADASAELRWAHSWLESHPSDHSAVHHRVQVAALLAKDLPRAARALLWTRELGVFRGLCLRRPGHQSLWYGRCAALHFFKEVLGLRRASSPVRDALEAASAARARAASAGAEPECAAGAAGEGWSGWWCAEKAGEDEWSEEIWDEDLLDGDGAAAEGAAAPAWLAAGDTLAALPRAFEGDPADLVLRVVASELRCALCSIADDGVWNFERQARLARGYRRRVVHDWGPWGSGNHIVTRRAAAPEGAPRGGFVGWLLAAQRALAAGEEEGG